jgi:hypothetical protein
MFIYKRFQGIGNKTDVFFTFRTVGNIIIIKDIFLDAFLTSMFDGDNDNISTAVFGKDGKFFVYFPVSVSAAFVKKVLGILQIEYRIAFIGNIIVVRQ